MDVLTPQERSSAMARIRGKDTKPEMRVRSCVHRLGYRFRLHDRGLLGSPDLVLRRLHTVIFVHGCFWHRHPRCKYAYSPRSRTQFWAAKFAENVARDQRALRALKAAGWRVITVWECQTRDRTKLRELLSNQLRAASELDGNRGGRR